MITTQNLHRSLNWADLLEGCLVGKKRSQEQMYHCYAPKMFGLCLRYSENYHSAEDVLQEGFIKVFQKLNDFRYEGSFEGWLKRIFINTAIEYNRKESKHRHLEIIEDLHLSLTFSAVEHLIKDDLIQLIQQLPAGYRQIFNLYVIDGFNHNEISKLLDISVGTSKSQLARARQTLKKQILQLDENQEQKTTIR